MAIEKENESTGVPKYCKEWGMKDCKKVGMKTTIKIKRTRPKYTCTEGIRQVSYRLSATVEDPCNCFYNK